MSKKDKCKRQVPVEHSIDLFDLDGQQIDDISDILLAKVANCTDVITPWVLKLTQTYDGVDASLKSFRDEIDQEFEKRVAHEEKVAQRRANTRAARQVELQAKLQEKLDNERQLYEQLKTKYG